MAELRTLYPAIKENFSKMLKVDDTHTIYYEESGNPEGVPVVFLHGGPGCGTAPSCRQYFDPEFYRIILFDQRGSGKSTPHACLENNDTWHIIEDIEKILTFTNDDKRMLFFSATMPPEIMKIAKTHMKEYEVLAVKSRELTTDLTEQIYFEVNERDKFEALCRIIDLTKEFYGIVFCRTKTDVNEIVGRLNDRGYDAEGLHGDIGQNYREVTLKRFKTK